MVATFVRHAHQQTTKIGITLSRNVCDKSVDSHHKNIVLTSYQQDSLNQLKSQAIRTFVISDTESYVTHSEHLPLSSVFWFKTAYQAQLLVFAAGVTTII